MTAMTEPVTSPHPWPLRPWMPAMFTMDAQGLPIRHRPGRWRHGDVWESRCGGQWLFDFPALRTVMELTPCLECADYLQP